MQPEELERVSGLLEPFFIDIDYMNKMELWLSLKYFDESNWIINFLAGKTAYGKLMWLVSTFQYQHLLTTFA